jgi:hypothetical protein
MNDPRYPVGKFVWPATSLTAAERAAARAELAALPAQVRAWLNAALPGALDKPYREGGWTARQVIHHLADSHLNSYARIRLALTEDKPTIKPYAEERWAELADARLGEVEPSVRLLEGLHARLEALLETLTEEQWRREFIHPERDRAMSLEATLAMYAWHSRHHLAHLGLVG